MAMKKLIIPIVSALLCIFVLSTDAWAADDNYIKWIDFTVTAEALADCAEIDIESHNSGGTVSWIDILSAIAVRYGGDFSTYNRSDAEDMAKRLSEGETVESITGNEKLSRYYKNAYGAVLGGMLGSGRKIYSDGRSESYYGVLAAFPLGAGYSFSHFDDFGASRSFGYKRSHLGHDLMGSIGTPIVAAESGYVECLGWNRFGGWRIGVRSFDGKRYYYYAHLRKCSPYGDICEGDTVQAGQVIGYMGMTGYSSTPDTNNINVPHLHYGLQIIFHPSQKDGTNQIWISMYELTNFLRQYAVKTDSGGSEYHIIPDGVPD
jgi:murein DD-endopeptidase MepM/ murein hydrolase activator NlpD